MEKGKSDLGGCSAGYKDLTNYIEVHWFEKSPDCVLPRLHLRQPAVFLHVLMSRSNCLLPRSQQNSLDGVESRVEKEEKIGKAARLRSRAVNHALRVLTLHFFSNLGDFEGKKRL